MLVPVEETLEGLSGPVMRHRYRSETGTVGAAADDTGATTQSVEITVTAAELQGMLREVAARGAIFDGRCEPHDCVCIHVACMRASLPRPWPSARYVFRYELAKGKGAGVQRKGRHSVLHFAARAAPAPSSGGRPAAVPPPPTTSGGARGDVALRFYLSRPAYHAVRELYSAPDTRACMPAVKELIPNARGVATGEHVLPPCVVSRRGESLAAWAKRAQPERPAMVRALADIADALAALHAQGLVYFALKPSDVIRLEGPTPWALSDFSAVVRQGAPPIRHPPAPLRMMHEACERGHGRAGACVQARRHRQWRSCRQPRPRLCMPRRAPTRSWRPPPPPTSGRSASWPMSCSPLATSFRLARRKRRSALRSLASRPCPGRSLARARSSRRCRCAAGTALGAQWLKQPASACARNIGTRFTTCTSTRPMP